MAAAIRLSRRHAGLTGDNPSVGALIVSPDGRIVGRGVTAAGGRPHAERVALADAGEAARGATAYVTLEPCAHHGRSGPCADAMVAAGIARAVVGAEDPDPRVDGKGFEILRRGGVEVRLLPARQDTDRAFEGFLSRLSRARPHVTLKMAVSADGFVGRRGEGQVAISGPIANRQTHLLRAECDAIMIGIGTALADDPALTCRLPGLEARSPVRLVLDPSLRLSPEAGLVRTAGRVPTWIASRIGPDSPRAAPLAAAGCRLLPLSEGEGALDALFAQLAALGLSSLLVEGGPTLGASLLGDGLVDRLIVVRAPVRIGGKGVAAPAGLLHVEGFRAGRRERFGPDLWCEYERIEG